MQSGYANCANGWKPKQVVSDDTFLIHLGGKLEIRSKVRLQSRADLSMAYTPGVARVCQAVAEDPDSSFNLTIRKNCIAVVSDGSAVLELGNIGPRRPPFRRRPPHPQSDRRIRDAPLRRIAIASKMPLSG